MMREILVTGLILVACAASAQVREVRGKVTYIAAGAIYTSLGRDAGVQDSSMLSIVSNGDTIATIKIFAVSSRSSAARVISSSRDPRIGDDIVGSVVEQTAEGKDPEIKVIDSIAIGRKQVSSPLSATEPDEDVFQVRGRLGLQYFTSLYSNPDFNLRQAGIVMNLRGMMTRIPLQLDLYANLRTLSVGRRSPLSAGSRNQSRVYNLAVSYDDTTTVISVGRIIPSAAPSVGYIDGVMISQRAGDFTVGASAGLQPEFSLRGISSDYKKLALFARYSPPAAGSVSLAYARTYFHSAIDREAVSLYGNLVLSPELFVYVNSEADLRRKSAGDFVLAPRLTNMYANIMYRGIRSLSIGIGADASRPYYSFETIRLVPDSLLVDELRSGASISLHWLLPGGIMLYNSFNPRSSEKGFGKEYGNHSSFNINNILSSGTNVRAHMNMNVSRFTKTTGYGVAVQRSFESMFDVTLRFNRSTYRISQTGVKNTSTTLGADVLVFLSRSLSLLATYDRLNGYGTISNALFAELSVRF